jgi:hypothetical protein
MGRTVHRCTNSSESEHFLFFFKLLCVGTEKLHSRELFENLTVALFVSCFIIVIVIILLLLLLLLGFGIV